MNRLRNLIICLCPALLMATGLARAETVVWSDNFDTNGASHWSASATGVWKISSPTAGPPLVSGSRTHSGADCASSQGYAYNKDARYVCIKYNGASSLFIPTNGSPRLRFYHWFNFANALGYVEISADGGGSWTQISPTYENVNGGGVWSRPSLNLSAYAGQNVQIAFHFTSGGCCGNGLGWFVDDVAVVTGVPLLNFPENFAAGLGDWSVDFGTWEVGVPTSGPGAAFHPATNCAATVLAGNYSNNVDSRLISPPFQVPASGGPSLRFMHWYNFNNALGYVEITTGTATITVGTNTVTTTNASVALNTNLYQFFGSTDANYSTPFYWNSTIGGWTNATKALGSVYDGTYGVFYFEAGTAPLSSVGGSNGRGGENDDYRPANNAIIPLPQSTAPTNFFALQGLTWEPVNDVDTVDTPVGYFATNATTTYTTNVSYSTNQSVWTQISPTYEDSTSGSWSNVSLDLSTYAGKEVQIAFHFTSGGEYTAPGWYVDDIVLAVPPQFAPTNQIINAGDDLDVPLAATNSVLPNVQYTFKLLSAPAGLLLTNGVVTWQTSSNQPSSTNTITVAVADNSVPPLGATNSFTVTVVNPCVLTVPPTQTNYAGGTLVVALSATNDLATNNDTFTFALLLPLATNLDASDLSADGTLTWPTMTTQPPGTYTIGIQVTDDNFPYSATNSFQVVVLKPQPPTLTVPARQVAYPGQQLTVTSSASSVYGFESSFMFQLLSAQLPGMDLSGLTSNGVLSWNVPTNQPAKNYTNVIAVVDSISQLSATNHFVIVVSNAPPPTLIVPPTQHVYAGQRLTVTNSASSVYGTNTSFVFQLLSTLPTGMDLSGLTNQGVLVWNVPTNQPAKNYTNVIAVLDSVSQLSTTNHFVIVVSNAPPPILTVPPTQHVYAGQRLTVTNSASSVYGTNTSFVFQLLSPPPPGMDLSGLTNQGVLVWNVPTNQPANNYTNVITVGDSVSQLSATNHFVIVVSNAPPPILTIPSTQKIFAGLTLTVTNSASSIYGTNSSFIFRLLSAQPTGMDLSGLTNQGVLVWHVPANQPAANYTNVITVVDSVSQLSATNHFVIVVSNAPPPILTVPSTQKIFVGLTLTVTNSASSIYGTNSSFIFRLLSAQPTGMDLSGLTNQGVLVWRVPANQPAANYTNVITVVDSVSQLSATNSFVVVVSNAPPPTLTVPPTQQVYAGQMLTVTNYASSIYGTNSSFTFQVLSAAQPGMNLSGLTTGAVLSWTVPTNQPAGSNTVTISVTDSISHLSATNNFLVVVSRSFPPPLLTVPPTQTIYAGQTLIVTNYAYYTNSVLPSSAFTFSLISGPTNNLDVSNLAANGILRWLTTTTQPAGSFTNIIMVVDGMTHLSATSNFLVQVLPPMPPTLIVPPTQAVYAGQPLIVTNYATNIAYPGSTFTFAAFGPTNLDVSNLSAGGVLKWTPTAAQAQSENTINVLVTENNSLSTNGSFLVLVFPTPSPALTASSSQPISAANGFQFTIHTVADTMWRIDASTNLLNWRPVSTNLAGPSGALQFTDPLATNYHRRFYRAVLP